MKFLLRLLGVSDYIQELQRLEVEDTKTITNLLDKNEELRTELNKILSEKSSLTGAVINLREQLEEANAQIKVLENINSEYIKNDTEFRTNLAANLNNISAELVKSL